MKLAVPETIPEALRLLSAEGARCLAGGQSLVAMMNAHLVEPTLLVSLRRIERLQQVVRREDGGLRLGAMVIHADVARLNVAAAGPHLLVQAARDIAHPAVRNQGTIGGSLAHADPAADYPTAVLCADATIGVAGPTGERRVAANDFFLGYYETGLQPGEILVDVEIPPCPANASAHYEKFSLVDGDFAVVSAAAIIGMRNGRCDFARLAIGACAARPVRSEAAETALLGSTLDDTALAEAGRLLAAACDPIDDFRGSAAYRLKMVPRLAARAIRSARAKAEKDHA
jgi:aerobic carbon-monoxide dehydrogenase medium subunit